MSDQIQLFKDSKAIAEVIGDIKKSGGREIVHEVELLGGEIRQQVVCIEPISYEA